MARMTRAQYANGILVGLGLRRWAILLRHRGARRALVAVMLAESGHEPCNGTSGARNNPLNTTQAEPGATNFNAVPVRNYPTAAEGIQAVLDTLHGDARFAGLITALRTRGVKAATVLDAWDRSPWGTHQPLLGEALQSFMLDRSYYNSLEVGP